MTVSMAMRPRKLTLHPQRKKWKNNRGWLVEDNAPDNTGALKATRLVGRGQVGQGYKIQTPAHIVVEAWVQAGSRFWIKPDGMTPQWFDPKPGWNRYDAHQNAEKARSFAIGGEDLLVGEVTFRWAPI